MLHTLRGKLKANEKRRLILDDGIFTSSHVVESFSVFPSLISSGDDVEALLAIEEAGLTGANDAADHRQIAWSFQFIGTNGGLSNMVIDSDRLIVRDLWIENLAATTCNYVIVVKPRELTEAEGVLALVREAAAS